MIAAAVIAGLSVWTIEPAAAHAHRVAPPKIHSLQVTKLSAARAEAGPPRAAPSRRTSRSINDSENLTPAPPTGTMGSQATSDTDVEMLRVQKLLSTIERDPQARARFYLQVQSIISTVRDGRLIPPQLRLDQEIPPPRVVLPPTTAPLLRSTPSLPPALKAPASPMPLKELASPSGTTLDPKVVSRLLYWARANGCPAQLALATAWEESRMNPHAPNGSSGEVGILQILPARARLEGVGAARLKDPDVNMWLATKLLARYYREESDVRRAAAKYVAGPHVFERKYSTDVWGYIESYAASVADYTTYFSQYSARFRF